MKIQDDLTKYISSALNNALPEKTKIKTRFHLLDAIVSIPVSYTHLTLPTSNSV